jgi:hypothetical protein
MNTNPNQKRHQKGTKDGGKFAPDVNAESTVLLDDIEETPSTAVNFGDVTNVRVGSRTPWGTADWVTPMAPGIVSVSTPGHGGVKLSPERNRKIPIALRQASGWYEEDCDVYIPMMNYPEAFVRDGQTVEEIREFGKQGVINWFPNGYETAFNTTLARGQSHSKDEQTWRKLHEDDEIAISASTAPDGMVEVTVCRGGRDEHGRYMSEEREILVPKVDYDNPKFRHPLGLHNGSFIVDLTKHYVDVTPPPKAPSPPAPRYRGIDLDRGSDSASWRAARDLAKRYRFSDGTVQSVREIIESGGITGKSSMEDNGRRTYYLRQAIEAEGQPGTDTFYSLEVSKALWNCVNAPAS